MINHNQIWMLGDVHGEYRYLHRALFGASVTPAWLVFLSDVDADDRPLPAYLDALRAQWPSLRFAFIHGNHDADSDAHWAVLHDCGDATPLYGRVATLGGLRVAGLGGRFCP